MKKRAILSCALLAVFVVALIGGHLYQQYETQRKTFELDLGDYNMNSQYRPSPDFQSAVAAERLARALVAHPDREIFILTWTRYSDDSSEQAKVEYNRATHNLEVSDKDTSSYLAKSNKITILRHKFAEVTDARIVALATDEKPLQKLTSYQCTRIDAHN